MPCLRWIYLCSSTNNTRQLLQLPCPSFKQYVNSYMELTESRGSRHILEESLLQREHPDDRVHESSFSNCSRPPTVLVTDKIFLIAYDYFKVRNILLLVYTALRTLIVPYYIYINSSGHVVVYLTCLLVASALQSFYHIQIHNLAQFAPLFYAIAQGTEHVKEVPLSHLPAQMQSAQIRSVPEYDFTGEGEEGGEEEETRMKGLAYEIKMHVQETNDLIYGMGRVQFALYQCVHVWGFILFLIHDFEDSSTSIFLEVVIVLGTYQYFEFYLFMSFIVLLVPFYCLRRGWTYLANKYRDYKLRKMLQSQPMGEHIKGDRECNICLMAYQENESIIVLKCNELHNFHATCLREWVRTSATCPLCRKNLLSM